MSDFSIIRAPQISDEDRERYAPVIELMRKAHDQYWNSQPGGMRAYRQDLSAVARAFAAQFQKADGESRLPAAMTSSTCLEKAAPLAMKSGSPTLSHGPAAMAQLSTVTGLPATRQAAIALLAMVRSLIVLMKARASSVSMAALRRLKRSRSHESGKGRKP